MAQQTLSWGRDPKTFIPEARRLAEFIWNQIMATPKNLKQLYSQQPALGGSGFQGASNTMTQGARGIRELKGQMDWMTEPGKNKRPSIADLTR